MIVSCRFSDEFVENADEDCCARTYEKLNKRFIFKVMTESIEDFIGGNPGSGFHAQVLMEPYKDERYWIYHHQIKDVKVHDVDAFL